MRKNILFLVISFCLSLFTIYCYAQQEATMQIYKTKAAGGGVVVYKLIDIDSVTFTPCEKGVKPGAPGAITGADAPCQNASGVAYSITPVAGATSYTWTVPAGATIASGQGTTAIIVNFGSTNGDICVTADNVYGSSATSCKTINLISIIAAPVPGTHSASQTQISWNWNTVADATGYKWNRANNYVSATDIGTNTTYIQTGLICNTVYTLYVWAYNACGNSTASTLTQTTSACGVYVCGQDGTFTDARDGQVYGYVKIGTQIWMCQNLNAGQYVKSNNTGSIHSDVSNNGIIEKYCYNNDPNNCNIYGGVYDWDEMMNYVTTEKTSGICPAGWHIPSDGEWTTLTTFSGGESIAGGKMKEVGLSHWNSPNTGATNSSGFTALPGGCRDAGGSFHSVGSDAFFWTSSSNGSDFAWLRYLFYDFSQVFRHYYYCSYGFSVRCVKD